MKKHETAPYMLRSPERIKNLDADSPDFRSGALSSLCGP